MGGGDVFKASDTHTHTPHPPHPHTPTHTHCCFPLCNSPYPNPMVWNGHEIAGNLLKMDPTPTYGGSEPHLTLLSSDPSSQGHCTHPRFKHTSHLYTSARLLRAVSKSSGLGLTQTWIQILPLSLRQPANRVTLGKQ